VDKETLQALYAADGYYWGTEPNALATRVGDYVSPWPEKTLIDLGAGEGRDSVYLAAQGFRVTAMDCVALGLEKALKLAAKNSVHLHTLEGDVNTVKFPQAFDVVYSIGALQYIQPQHRPRQFDHFKANTTPKGVHVLFAFLDHPDVAVAPDWGQNEFLYQINELKSYYENWRVLSQEQIIFDCNSSDVSHQHAADILIVQKP